MAASVPRRLGAHAVDYVTLQNFRFKYAGPCVFVVLDICMRQNVRAYQGQALMWRLGYHSIAGHDDPGDVGRRHYGQTATALMAPE